MPQISTWVPQTYECITRPVAIGIVRDLAQKLGMSPDLRINFPGFAEQVAQAGSNLTQNPMGNNYWPNSDKMFVDVTEIPRASNALATAVFRPDNPLCFHDPRVHTTIRPVYEATEMVLSLRYRAPNRTIAERWRDDIIVRYHRGRVENLHSITYAYQIPYAFLLILSEIGTLKEKKAPYGETLLEWVQKYITSRATTVTDLAGKNPLLTIGETQQAVIGWFDFDFEPDKIEKEGEAGACTVSFEYHIDYDKVVQCAMAYPLVVHNQLISSRFRDKNQPEQLGDMEVSRSMSRTYFDALTPRIRQPHLPTMPWLRVPSFDDWMVPHGRNTLSTLATFMVQVDESNPKELINLTQLGDYAIKPEILKFMASEGPYLGVFGQSIFHFGLFEESSPLPDGHLTWDSAYNLGFDLPLDLRERYHLRWSVVNDLSLLTPEALDRLGQHPDAADIILDSLGDGKDPCYTDAPRPERINDRYYTKQLLAFAQSVKVCQIKRVGVPTNSGLPLTVGSYLINAFSAPSTQA